MSTLPFDEMLRIEAGSLRDYRALAEHHYKSGPPYAPTEIYAMRHENLSPLRRLARCGPDDVLVGVLVMARPQLCCAPREAATGGRYRGLSRRESAALINREVSAIARVIVDPRYRGLGFAARLVRHALAHAATPYVEALAAMGRVNPFFERAGMVKYEPPPRPADARLLDALAEVKAAPALLMSRDRFAAHLEALTPSQRDLIERELARWGASAAFMERRPSVGAAPGDVVELARRRLLARCVYYLHHDATRRPA